MILFLLENLAWAADEAAPGFTLREIWQHSGGIARTVIVMLVVMFLGTIFTGFERALAFFNARRQSRALAQAVVKPLQGGDISGALKVASKDDYKASYLGSILRAGLRELEQGVDQHGVENARRAVEKAHGEELSKMKRGMTILATVGSTAPFVGLFGTTFGVINAFQGMASEGAGLASISAGISEALITTGVGIGVAVFGVWLFNYFNARVDKVADELRSSDADFMQWAEKLRQSRAGK
jgi:biopolymer transport protein ExbB/TolQ